jgi:hypothetical protein
LWLTHFQHYSMFSFLRTFARSNTLHHTHSYVTLVQAQRHNSHPLNKNHRRGHSDLSLHEMLIKECWYVMSPPSMWGLLKKCV